MFVASLLRIYIYSFPEEYKRTKKYRQTKRT